MRSTRQVVSRVVAFLLFVLVCSGFGNGYSVLTHEEIVDLLWKDRLRPMLLERFPQASEEDLKQAHSYAYGGSVIQDMGYYPFGSKYFSDLVHYVRSGDFVEALLQDHGDAPAGKMGEYGFGIAVELHRATRWFPPADATRQRRSCGG